jgi:hypothetical protein
MASVVKLPVRTSKTFKLSCFIVLFREAWCEVVVHSVIRTTFLKVLHFL